MELRIKKLTQTQYRWLAFGWVLMITLASSVSDTPNLSQFNLDKLIHILIFMALAFLLAGSFQGETQLFNKNPHITNRYLDASLHICFIITITLIIGLIDEFHQSLVSGRTASFKDIMADGIGGLVGAMTYRIINHENK